MTDESGTGGRRASGGSTLALPLSPATTHRPRSLPVSFGDRARVIALVASLICLGGLGGSLAPVVKPSCDDGTSANGFGWEARRLAAQLLWDKTHAVLHAGAEEREARPGEEVTRAGEFHSHGAEGHQEHVESPHEEGGEHGQVLVIPPAREDFRSVLGDLERAVKPYADGSGRLYSKDVDQTLPFYRVITLIDPHFVPGYVVGASIICRAGQYPGKAFAFLLEGERNNPDSFEIQTELGHFYLVYRRDYAQAERHLRRGLDLLPRGRHLTGIEEDSRADAYRWLALTYRDSHRPADAARVAAAGAKILGDDVTLRKILESGGRG